MGNATSLQIVSADDGIASRAEDFFYMSSKPIFDLQRVDRDAAIEQLLDNLPSDKNSIKATLRPPFEFDYQTAAAKDTFDLQPYINTEVFKKWELDKKEANIYLELLRSNRPELSDAYIAMEQLKIMTAQNAEIAKAMTKNFSSQWCHDQSSYKRLVDAICAENEAKLKEKENQEKNKGVKIKLIPLALQTLNTFIDDIKDSKEQEAIDLFLMAIAKISETLKPGVLITKEESFLSSDLESLCLELVYMISNHKQLFGKQNFETTLRFIVLLTNYIDKVAPQLKVINALIKEDLFKGVPASIFEPSECYDNITPLFIGNKEELFFQPDCLPISEIKDLFVVSDFDFVAVYNTSKVWFFHKQARYSNFELVEPPTENSQLNCGVCFFNRNLWLPHDTDDKIVFAYEPFMDSNHQTKMINFQLLTEAQIKSAIKTKNHSYKEFGPLITTQNLGGDDNLFYRIYYYKIKINTTVEIVPFLASYRIEEQIINNSINATVHNVVALTNQAGTDLRLISMNTTKFSRCTYYRGVIIQHAADNNYNIFCPTSGAIIKEKLALPWDKGQYSGVDQIKSYFYKLEEVKIKDKMVPRLTYAISEFYTQLVAEKDAKVEASDPKLAEKRQQAHKAASYLGYMEEHDDETDANTASKNEKSTSDDEPEQNNDGLLYLLEWQLRKAMSAKTLWETNFNSEDSLKREVAEFLNQDNKFDFRTETMNTLQELTSRIVQMKDPRLILPILKLLELYISTVYMHQDPKQDSLKLINQECIFRLRMALENCPLKLENVRGFSYRHKSMYHRLYIQAQSYVLLVTNKILSDPLPKVFKTFFSDYVIHEFKYPFRILFILGSQDQIQIPRKQEFIDVFVDTLIEKIKQVGVIECQHLEIWPSSPKSSFSCQIRENLINCLLNVILIRPHIGKHNQDKLLALAKDITNMLFSSLTKFSAERGHELKNTKAYQRFNFFVTSLLSYTVFHKYLIFYLYDDILCKTPEFLSICKRFITATQEIQFPGQTTDEANDKPADLASLPLLKEYSVQVENNLDLKQRVKYFKLSFPGYKRVLIKTENFSTPDDVLFVSSVHKVPNIKQYSSTPSHIDALVPMRTIHTNGEFKIKTSELVLVLRNQWVSEDSSRKPSFKVYGYKDEYEVEGLFTTYQICLTSFTDQCRRKINNLDVAPKVQDVQDPKKEIRDSVIQSLNVVLNSRIFDFGFSKENLSKIDKKLEPAAAPATDTMEDKVDQNEDLCSRYYNYICQIVELSKLQQTSFDNLCSTLQKRTQARNIHSRLMGETGMYLAKATFLVMLYHMHQIRILESLSLEDNATMTILEKNWLDTSKVRVHCRGFEAEDQFIEYFKKIYILLSLKPAEEEIAETAPELGLTKRESSQSHPLQRVKTFYEDLKIKKFAKSKDQVTSIPDLVLKFLTLELLSNEVVELLDERQRKFEVFSSALQVIEELVNDEFKGCSSSNLSLINQMLRKADFSLDYLTVEYAGLAKSDIEARVKVIKRVMTSIVDYLAAVPVKKSSEHPILLAIDTLKWRWRAKETSCMLAIDIDYIITTNPALLENAQIVSSLIELAGIILSTTASKTKEESKANPATKQLSGMLSGPIEENSKLSEFAVKNLQFFMTLLKKSTTELENIKAIDCEADWPTWHKRTHDLQRNRMFDYSRWYIEDKLKNSSDKDDGNLLPLRVEDFHYGCNDGAFKSKNKKTIGNDKADKNTTDKPEEKKVEPTKELTKEEKHNARSEKKKQEEEEKSVSIGGLFDDFPEPTPAENPVAEKPKEVVIETKDEAPNEDEMGKPKKLSLQGVAELLTKTFGENDSKIGSFISHSITILTHLQIFALSSGELTRLYFSEHTKQVKLIEEIAFGCFPIQIKSLALKTLQSIQNAAPSIFSITREHLESLIEFVMPSYEMIANGGSNKRSALSKVDKNTIVSILQDLLISERSSELVGSILKEMIASNAPEKIYLALDILDMHFCPIVPGSLVVEKGDPMVEQYVVLPKKPGLEGKAYLREIVNIRFDIKLSGTARNEEFSKRGIGHSVLALCVRTRHYRFFHRYQIEGVRGYFDKNTYENIVRESGVLGLIDKAGDQLGGLYVLSRISSILASIDNAECAPFAQKLLARIPSETKTSNASRAELNSIIGTHINRIITKTMKGFDPTKEQVPLGDILKPEAPKSVSNKFNDLKSKFYSKIKANSDARPIKLIEKPQPVDFNVYNYGLNTLPSNTAVILTNPCLHETLYSLIKLNCESLLVKRSPSASLIKTNLSSANSQELISRLSSPIQMPSFAEVKTDLDRLIKDRLIAQIYRTNKQVVESVKRDYLTAAETLELLQRASKRNWPNVVRCMEAMERLLAYLPTKRVAEDKEGILADAQVCNAMDTIFSLLCYNPMLNSGSAGLLHKIERIQNVLFSLCRLSLENLTPAQSIFIKCPKQTVSWLESINYKLRQATLDDLKADDIIIKGILTWLLNNNKIDDPRFTVTMKKDKFIHKLDLSKYRNWMYTDFVEEKDIVFRITADEKGEETVAHCESYSHVDGELGMRLRFSTDPAKSYYIRPDVQRDFYMCGDLENQVQPIVSHYKKDSIYATECVREGIVVNGNLFSKTRGNYPVLDKITLALKHDRGSVMYRGESKEAYITARNNVTEDLDYPYLQNYSLTFDMESYYLNYVDLSTIPKLTTVLSYIEKSAYLAKDETGALLLMFVDPDPKDECCGKLMRRAIPVLFSRKRLQLRGSMFYIPPNPQFEVTHFASNRECLAVFAIKMKGGSKIYVWYDSGATEYFFEFPGKTIKKLDVHKMIVIALFDDGRVFVKDIRDNENFRNDFKEAKQKITTNVEKNPSLIEQSKIIDFNMVYKSAFIGIQEIEVESTDAAKIGQKEKNYQYQTLWGSTDPNGIGEQLLSSTSLLAENSEEDTRDIYIRNIRPVKHSEFICKKGKTDLDYSTRHTWKYPLILYLTKNNEEYRTLPYTNEKSLDHPDLSHCKICMVLTRPLRFRSFSPNFIKEYEQSSETTPEEYANVKSLSFNTITGINKNSSWPTEFNDKDWLWVRPVKGGFRAGIVELVEKIKKEISPLLSSMEDTKLTIFPDFHAMNQAEFDVFKEDVKAIWEPLFANIKKNYIAYKRMCIEVSYMSTGNNYTQRSDPARFLNSVTNIVNTSEHGWWKETQPKNCDTEIFKQVFCSTAVMNSYYAEYYNRMPVWRGRNLDESYIEKSKDNVFGLYFLNYLKPRGDNDTCCLEIDKFKSLKETSLKKQNFSLINQTIYEFDKRFQQNTAARNNYGRLKFELRGEGATDAGGPRREMYELLCVEIISRLKLFIPSPNNTGNVGEERDRYVPNPMANSPCDLDNFYKLGILLGMALKGMDSINLVLSSTLWKYLLSYPLNLASLRSCAENQANCFDQIPELKPDELEELDAKHVAYLLSGKETEIYPGSSQITLNTNNRTDYLISNLKIQLGQLEKPYHYLRKGFRTIFPSGTLLNITPDMLEKNICGMTYVDIELLKKITIYKNFGDDPFTNQNLKWFWKILEGFTQEELSKYLKYVWGRARLSTNILESHRVSYVSGKKGMIPETHTCFFEIDIFDYDSEEDFRKKLKYGMDNCTMIVESSNTLYINL